MGGDAAPGGGRVTGVVLCAGRGTRLAPLTERLPKPLVPVAGVPMVHYPLALLRAHGIRRVVLNAHHLADRLEAALGDGRRWGMELIFSREPRLLGTGGGLRHLAPLLDGTAVVLNTDQITDLDLHRLLAHHRRAGACATLAVVEAGPEFPHRRLAERHGWLAGLAPEGARRGPLFTGCYCLEPDLLRRHHPPDPACILRHFLLPEAAAGGRVALYRHAGVWLDTGEPAGIARAEAALAAGLAVPRLAHQR
ncbi:MAG: nucleotidyltransferase family protein [Nitrospirae bacterium]|nr:MAG: nucleotidyltransferase family protein [Nitrospirota bacterium]